MKVKLFSHCDYDGLSCAIIAKCAFKDLDISYCSYDDIDKKVMNFIANEESYEYDKIFITDISVNKETAEQIELYLYENPLTLIKLLDHHKSALWLNEYSWASVIEEEILFWKDGDGLSHKTSGGYLFLKYLSENEFEMEKIERLGEAMNLSFIVENSRRYDCWEWDTFYHDDLPKKYNNLLYILGKEKFIENIMSKIYSRVELDKTDLLLLELEQNKIDRYIKAKNKELIIKEINGLKAGIVFGEQFHSELGNELCKSNPELDFIAIINPSKAISYRSIGDCDVSIVAKEIGNGGGHFHSSGNPISNEIRENIINMVFNSKIPKFDNPQTLIYQGF